MIAAPARDSGRVTWIHCPSVSIDAAPEDRLIVTSWITAEGSGTRTVKNRWESGGALGNWSRSSNRDTRTISCAICDVISIDTLPKKVAIWSALITKPSSSHDRGVRLAMRRLSGGIKAPPIAREKDSNLFMENGVGRSSA